MGPGSPVPDDFADDWPTGPSAGSRRAGVRDFPGRGSIRHNLRGGRGSRWAVRWDAGCRGYLRFGPGHPDRHQIASLLTYGTKWTRSFGNPCAAGSRPLRQGWRMALATSQTLRRRLGYPPLDLRPKPELTRPIRGRPLDAACPSRRGELPASRLGGTGRFLRPRWTICWPAEPQLSRRTRRPRRGRRG